jgi:hypothetical protein
MASAFFQNTFGSSNATTTAATDQVGLYQIAMAILIIMNYGYFSVDVWIP